MMIRRIGEEKYLLKEIGPIQNSTLFDQESGQFSCLLMVGELILCFTLLINGLSDLLIVIMKILI